MQRDKKHMLVALLVATISTLGCGPKTTEKPKSSDAPTVDKTADDTANDPADTVETKTDDVADKTPSKSVEAGEPASPPANDVESAASGKAMLGSPELTSGILGEGELTDEDIEQWLAKPGVHAVLQPVLPAGVGWGAPHGLDENPLTLAKIELGRQLYFDTRLSSDSTISCASCHDPDHGYGFDSQFGVGVQGQMGGRNSPVAYNRIFSGPQFWDGRAESLEAQAVGPIANPIEMGNTHEIAVKTLSETPGYKMQFDKIFPGEGVTIDNVGKAIATFERVIITGASPYDYYEPYRAFTKQFADDLEDLEAFKEDEPQLYARYMQMKQDTEANPMSEPARRGRELFFGKAKCTECHAGANFSDEKYHNLGVGMMAEEPDLGRYEVSKKEEDKGAFKTPTCRNVAQTAPYMHDGSQKTLLEVVQWYNKGGHPNPYLSKRIVKLNLTESEEKDLVAFMEALTGPLPKVERGRLPKSPSS